MTRFTCAVLGGIAASALSIAAQTQSVPPGAGAPGSTVTVTGCVEQAVADGSIGGTPLGTSATPANAGVIANAQRASRWVLSTGARPATPSAVGTTGAAGAAPADSRESSKEELRTYALDGDRNELAAHKGHRVEITGTLAPPVSSGANAPASREFQTGVQRLRVQALKMTAESCKQGLTIPFSDPSAARQAICRAARSSRGWLTRPSGVSP